MTAPAVIEDRSVCWCITCCIARPGEPDWATQHHAETGHTTARRTWQVERWGEVR